MRLFWKFLCGMAAITALACGLGGYLLIDAQFRGGLEQEVAALYEEMNAQQTTEARLCKALDKLEAVIQHNESPIDTWEPHEYELNLTYAFKAVAFSPWLKELRQAIYEDTEEKIREKDG